MQYFSFGGDTLVALDPGEWAHLQVSVNFPGSPTDNAIVQVEASADGTTFDLTPYFQIGVDKGTDPNTVSFLVDGVVGFRVGVKRDGSTDTLTSADAILAKSGVSL